MFWQGTLFGTDGLARIDAAFGSLEQTTLDATSWIDIARGWLTGADDLFDALVTGIDWQQRIVTMFDRRLPEPRLTAWWREGGIAPAPLAVIDEARAALGRRYGCRFDSIGYNWYRTGADSVAWHGDRFAKQVRNPTIAIVSVGAPRPFRLRPRAGGRGRAFDLGHGDLLVMGGACQHDWQHCVPKMSRPVGPRISITFRHDADYRPRARRYDINQIGADGSPRQ